MLKGGSRKDKNTPIDMHAALLVNVSHTRSPLTHLLTYPLTHFLPQILTHTLALSLPPLLMPAPSPTFAHTYTLSHTCSCIHPLTHLLMPTPSPTLAHACTLSHTCSYIHPLHQECIARQGKIERASSPC